MSTEHDNQQPFYIEVKEAFGFARNVYPWEMIELHHSVLQERMTECRPATISDIQALLTWNKESLQKEKVKHPYYPLGAGGTHHHSIQDYEKEIERLEGLLAFLELDRAA